MAEALSTKSIRALAALAVATAAIALSAAPAIASPPKIETAGATSGLATATWSLPPNISAQFFQVGRYLEVNPFGYFQCNRAPLATKCGEGESNVVRFGVLGSDQTSLTADDAKPALPAGTYYVHIAGHDNVHTGCPLIEFSDIIEVTIAADGSATSSNVVAPGTGDCTLGAGAGAGGTGGGGGPGGGVPGDSLPPTVQLRFSKRQDIDKLRVRARMSEPGTLTARALVDVGGLLAKIYTFRPKTRKVSGGLLTSLPLKISKKKKGALKRAMRRGKRLRARVTLTAVDRAGNTTTKHAVIGLKR